MPLNYKMCMGIEGATLRELMVANVLAMLVSGPRSKADRSTSRGSDTCTAAHCRLESYFSISTNRPSHPCPLTWITESNGVVPSPSYQF
jgi:hypothetical protein